ncbi:NB-ARC domain-containing protein [Geodermatophilus obscurus]|uniref:NB-ARC domain-containing protein n=2 Tax=Geodermatophilus obscurus TaxID=1861 RepID=A0A1I5DP79_9ACTN|nr:NB-ARC domain-containing protein [Geodermatophilus obscurus]
MRDIIEHYILDHLSEEEALGNDYGPVAQLRESDVGDQPVSIVHYLYTRQAYDLLNRHRTKLPGELADELRVSATRMDELVPVRNRVMHGRPLRVDDPERAVSALQGFTTRHWAATHAILRRLAQDSTWEPAFATLPSPTERILHNLPEADYDETGLIGRSDELVKLKTLVQKRREAIVTITGEGGIGKTALALEVAYAIVDDPASDFDCVLWASLKSELLTVSGVRTIEKAIKDLTGATQEFGRTLDQSFNGSVAELADSLQGIRALIIIDNLESAKGDEVLRLYDTLPETATYLLTSRVGIGQIERRFPLGALQQKDAELLLRKMASMRGLRNLARLTSRTANEVLARLRFSPLAIRWYVLSVEAGREPSSALRDQAELIRFCVKNVYDALSVNSKHILSVLESLDRGVTFDELAVLTDLTIDDLRSAAQELGRGSLVVHQPDPQGGLASQISLSAAASLFLRTQPRVGPSAADILAREDAYIKSAERRRADEAARGMGPNVVRVRGPEDEPTAHLLRLALSHSKRGDTETSRALIDRARALNPDYWETDRVAAFVASSSGRREEAVTLYKSALVKAQAPEEKAIVAYFLAGHLARAMHELELALPYAVMAHQILQSGDTALSLGTYRVWNREFEEGQALLEDALDSTQEKTWLIALTSLVESWRRWAEADLEGHRAMNAFEKAYAGFNVGAEKINVGIFDGRLAGAVLESVTIAFRAASHRGVLNDEVARQALVMLTAIKSRRPLYRGQRNWTVFVRHLAQWLREGGSSSHVSGIAQEVLGDALDAGPARQDASVIGDLAGEIVSWRGRYGFIAHSEYPRNVFFHRGSLGSQGFEPRQGAMVLFRVEESDGDRPRAVAVRPLGASM